MKVADDLLPAVQTHLRIMIRQVAKRHWSRNGWVAFAVDGTKIDCPRTVANETGFGTAGKAGCSPQQLLTTLWHMGTGLPWAWIIGRAAASERDHLRQLAALLPLEALLVADAGFTGFDLLSGLQQRGVYFLVRVGANVTLLRNLGYAVEQRGSTVYLWPTNRRDRPPLVLRMIRVKPSRADTSAKSVVLITNVLDPDQLSDEQAAVFYQMRWGVEVFYRSLKQTLQHRTMRSAAPRQARIELHSALIGLLLMGLMSVSGIINRKCDPLNWSVALALRIVRGSLRGDGRARRTLLSNLGRALKDSYPRHSLKKAYQWAHKKRNPPPGEPRVRPATTREVRAAQAFAPIANNN